MTIPSFTIRQLLESGVHFGHHTRRWNPKMTPYIFGVRNNIHIINLEETVPLLTQALSAIREVAAAGGRILFVGTKKSCSEIIADSAKSCGQYYVNHRWLGGMMTNFSTVSNSIKRLKELDEKLESEDINALSKKEVLKMTRDRDKLNNSLGGIKDMGGLPDMLFVIDTIKDSIAISEAKTLNIPVVAVLDTNSNPDGIDYPIPGNDDALRAVTLYCNLVSESIIDGLQAEMLKQEKDFDPVEKLPEQIDNESSNNEASESNKDTVNETKGPSSKNEIKDKLPNEEEKVNNSVEKLEIIQKKNTNEKIKKENDKKDDKTLSKNKAKPKDDKKSLENVEKPEKKSSKKETTKKSVKDDESSSSKKKTKQVKEEIIDNEVEKELKTTSKSKSPKPKK
jgi:small subunit ribosomal protein S2